MKPVLNTEPPVARVELEVVEIVELRGEAEREVVTGVIVDDLHLYETEPEPHQRNGTSHEQHAVADWGLPSEEMFQGVSVDSSRSDGSRPLVVDLVDVFVDQAVVEQAVAVVEPDVVAEHADQDVSQGRGEAGQLSDVPVGGSHLVETNTQVAGWDTQSYLDIGGN